MLITSIFFALLLMQAVMSNPNIRSINRKIKSSNRFHLVFDEIPKIFAKSQAFLKSNEELC